MSRLIHDFVYYPTISHIVSTKIFHRHTYEIILHRDFFLDWTTFVDEQILKWKKTNLDWVYNFTNPLHIVFYDDLVNDLEPNLREIVNFIGLNVTEDEFKCAMNRREGIYRRKKRLFSLDPFTKDMKHYIKITKDEVYYQIHSFIQNQKSNR